MAIMDHPDGTRTCTNCGNRQSITRFDIDKKAPTGRRGECKSCRSGKMKAWYAANQERQMLRQRDRFDRNRDNIREQDRQRYYRNREKRIALVTDAGNARRVAMKNGRWVRGITLKSLRRKHGNTCCYCNVRMTFEPATGHHYTPNKATIEHIIPVSAGGAHDWDNTTLACWQCNVRKNRMPLEKWLNRLAALALDGSAPTATQLAAPHPTLW